MTDSSATTSKQWQGWIFQAENEEIKIKHTVGKEIFMSEINSFITEIRNNHFKKRI